MKKVTSLVLIVLLVGFLGGCSSPQKAEAPVVLKIHNGEALNHPNNKAILQFAEKVKERTSGRVTFALFPDNQLGDDKVVLQSVQLGAVAGGQFGAAAVSEVNTSFRVFQLPYVFNSPEHQDKVLFGKYGQEFLSKLEKNNLVGLSYLATGPRQLWTAKKQVLTPEDLAGLKIRVNSSKVNAEVIRSFGGNPQFIAYGETYNAIKSGMMDGVELETASMVSKSMGDVLKYGLLTYQIDAPDYFVFSKKVLDGLSAADKKVVKEEAVSLQRLSFKLITEEEKLLIAAMRAKGMIVSDMGKNREAWEKAAMRVYPLFPELTPLVTEIKAIK